MDTTDSEITFSADGLCSYCLWFDESARPILEDVDKAQKLNASIEKIKEIGVGKEFDCIIGLSGGADSSYLLIRAIELGLRPLAVHVDGGWNSETAVANIHSLVSTFNLELETEVINWSEMQDLQLSFLRSGVPNQDIPQDHAFFTSLMRVASREKIKVVLNGNNLATESVLPRSWGYSYADGLHLKSIHKKFGTTPLRSFPVSSVFDHRIYWSSVKGIQSFRMLNFLDYSREIALKSLKEIGWRSYGAKHNESDWTRFFQNFYLPYRFGFDKRKAHLSSEILSGAISRAEAMKQVQLPLMHGDELELYMRRIANKLEISNAELSLLVNAPLHEHNEFPQATRLNKIIDTGRTAANKLRWFENKFAGR